MKKALTVWFDDKGNLVQLLSRWGITNLKSEEAKDFVDTLEYVNLTEYRTARANFKSVNTGREYSMWLGDFHEVLKNRKMIDNTITGTFRFVKRGQAQAIKLIIEKAP